MGRPVIAAKNGGVEENWQDDFGILVEKHNIEQGAEALRKIRENYRKYNLKYISDEMLKMYSSGIIYKCIEKHFRKSK